MADPKPGDPGYLDWLIEKAGGTTRPAAVTPAPAAPAPSAGRTTTPSASPTYTPSAPRNLQAENLRNEIAIQDSSGRFVQDGDPRLNGFWRLGDASLVNPQTREVWNRDDTSGRWSTKGYRESATAMRTYQTEVQQGKREVIGSNAPTSGTPIPTSTPALTRPTAPTAAPATTGGQFFRDQASFDAARAANYGYLPGQVVNLDRGLQRLDPETGRPPSSFRGELNQYDEFTRGGPGRAGFTPIAVALDSSAGGRGVFGGLPGTKAAAPYSRNLFADSRLLLPDDYGPDVGRTGGRDFYDRGEPSVATNYRGGAATLSTGTAGGEIRGGERGGFGFDTGAILGAHGIAPSGDPLVDAARAAEIAADMGLYDPNGAPADNAPVAFASGGYVGAASLRTGQSLRTRRQEAANSYPARMFRQGFTDQGLGDMGGPLWVLGHPDYRPHYTPEFRLTPDAWNQQFADDAITRFAGRRAQQGLAPLQAIDLAPDEVPLAGAPPGYYYRRPSEAAEQRQGQREYYDKGAEIGEAERLAADTRRRSFAASPQGWGGGGQQSLRGQRFAYGGEVSSSFDGADVTPQANGRKSMVVSEPSIIAGMYTGTPFGIMGEAGAEMLTDVGNRLRIDPIAKPVSFRSPLALGIATSAANGLRSWR